MLISLVVLPGSGLRQVRVAEGTTLAQLAEAEGLSARQFCFDGAIVPKAEWATTTLIAGREYSALAGSKGN
jgi:sulfur carrier protein ThiS